MTTVRIKQEVVINTVYGGFDLSERAVHDIAARKLCKAVNLGDDRSPFWMLQNEETGFKLDLYDIERNDPHLIETVRALGDLASGSGSRLTVETVDIYIEIQNFDGKESIRVG